MRCGQCARAAGGCTSPHLLALRLEGHQHALVEHQVPLAAGKARQVGVLPLNDACRAGGFAGQRLQGLLGCCHSASPVVHKSLRPRAPAPTQGTRDPPALKALAAPVSASSARLCIISPVPTSSEMNATTTLAELICSSSLSPYCGAERDVIRPAWRPRAGGPADPAESFAPVERAPPARFAWRQSMD
jgi:hypothetical protein